MQMEAMDSIAGEADHLDHQSEHDEQDRHSEHSDHDQNAADPEGSKFISVKWLASVTCTGFEFDSSVSSDGGNQKVVVLI